MAGERVPDASRVDRRVRVAVHVEFGELSSAGMAISRATQNVLAVLSDESSLANHAARDSLGVAALRTRAMLPSTWRVQWNS